MQWQDLHCHFPGFPAVARADDHARHRFVWEQVQEQPHIVAHYLAI
jgi:hypothetical protein